MRLKLGMYSFQTHDAAAMASFWGQLLDIPVDEGANEQFATLDFAGDGPTWMFHWPSGSSEDSSRSLGPPVDRFMLDLVDLGGGPDWQKEAARAEELGATDRADREVGGARWAELRDPDGNMFRIFGPRPQ